MIEIDNTITASHVDCATRADPPPMPQLIITFRRDAPQIPLSRHLLGHIDRVEIRRGRVARCERLVIDATPTLILELPDGLVSSRHAMLHRQGRRWTLTDCASKNGIWLKGARLTQPCLLQDGDSIEIGSTVLMYRDAVATDLRMPADCSTDELEPAIPEWTTFHGPLAMTYERLERVAPSAIPVLMLGETGTGKEVVAQGVHRLSRPDAACVAVNCAAVSDSLAEAEFFGHERGAFTGAQTRRPGWIRSANQGTLFLDEIGDLRSKSQGILLRALEEKRVVPVGARQAIAVDFRLIAATNQDLGHGVAAGTFRADLRARLGRMIVSLPPLKDHLEDLGLLVRRILSRLQPDSDPPPELSSDAFRTLMQHDWPGNVRELVHTLELALTLAQGRPIERHDLPAELLQPIERQPPAPSLTSEQIEHRAELTGLLEETHGNVAEIGRRLNVHRQTLHRWFKRYKLHPELYRSQPADH